MQSQRVSQRGCHRESPKPQLSSPVWLTRHSFTCPGQWEGEAWVRVFICPVFCKDTEADWLMRDTTLFRLPSAQLISCRSSYCPWHLVVRSTIPTVVALCLELSRHAINIYFVNECMIPTCQALCQVRYVYLRLQTLSCFFLMINQPTYCMPALCQSLYQDLGIHS